MRKNRIFLVIFVLLAAVAVGAFVWLFCHFYEGSGQQIKFHTLSTATTTSQTEAPEKPRKSYLKSLLTHGRPESEPPKETPKPTSHDLAALREQNPDCIGWVSVPGTGIDYPLMWTPDDPERYLHLNFDREWSDYGVPFLDAHCTPDSGNLILYGHNKFDGTMFTPVIYFNDPAVLESCPKILVELDGEAREYRTIAAFHTDTDSPVYSHTHISSQEDVIEFLADLRLEYPQLEEFEAQEGTEFVTLSTCEISKPNGRAILVGMR